VGGLEPYDWAYLAGMIDGEGTITTGSKGRIFSIRVYQKDRRVLDYLCQTFGVGNVRKIGDQSHTINGRVYPYSGHVWHVAALIEVWWMIKGILPYLHVKKEKAESALLNLETHFCELNQRTRKRGGLKVKSVADQVWPNILPKKE